MKLSNGLCVNRKFQRDYQGSKALHMRCYSSVFQGWVNQWKKKINVWDSIFYVDKDDINLLRWAEMFYRHFIPELGNLTCYHTWTTTGPQCGGDGQVRYCVVRQLEDTGTLFAGIPKMERKELSSNARIYRQHWGRETHSLGRAWRTVTSMSVPQPWSKLKANNNTEV